MSRVTGEPYNMIPDDRLIREAQERAHRIQELATRLDHFMEQLARHRSRIDSDPGKREENYRKVTWVLSELPGKMSEFEEAYQRFEQSVGRLDSRVSAPPASGSRVRQPKTPTRPYFPAVEVPLKKVV